MDFRSATIAIFSALSLLGADVSGCSAASKRRASLQEAPEIFAELYIRIIGNGKFGQSCFDTAAFVDAPIGGQCEEVRLDLKSFAKGFDYKERDLDHSVTACRVLERLSGIDERVAKTQHSRCHE
jgi:hypothetical protein